MFFKVLISALNFIQKYLAYFIPIALVGGLVTGHYAPMQYSRVICVSALLIMIFPVFINLEMGKGMKEIPSHKGVLTLSAIVNFLIYPMVAIGIGWLFLRDYPAMWLGLVLLSLVPTSGMTINWTYFTKGNMHVAMGIVSVGILMSVFLLPINIPFIAEKLMGAGQVSVDKLVILEKLFFVIVLPIIFGAIVRNLIIRFKGYETFKSLKPINGSISAFGVLVVSFLVMALDSTQVMVTNFNILWIALLPVLLFYGLIFLISHFLSRTFFNAETGKAFFFGTAARYHVITLGVALGSFQKYDFLGGIVLVIAIGLAVQIPGLAFYARWVQNKKSPQPSENLDVSIEGEG